MIQKCLLRLLRIGPLTLKASGRGKWSRLFYWVRKCGLVLAPAYGAQVGREAASVDEPTAAFAVEWPAAYTIKWAAVFAVEWAGVHVALPDAGLCADEMADVFFMAAEVVSAVVKLVVV